MTVLISGTELAQRLEEAVAGSVDGSDEFQVWVKSEQLIEICRFLKETPNLAFDFLSSVTAVDYVEHFELVYHVTSMGFNHRTVLKARVFGRLSPEVPSIASVWRGAELQEREIWDLMGIKFLDHPNLKRIMLWEGFPGHPHRKDHLGG
jgi:NADH-quinone oxidoreductase subunit C